MDSEAERTIAALDGALEDRISAARTLKNAVVGNPTNKRHYLALGVVLRLVKCVDEFSLHPELASQAVAVLGSLSSFFSPHTMNQVTPAVLRCLFSSDTGLVNAAARALKLFTIAKAFRSSMLSSVVATKHVASRLVFLLNSSKESISEVCAVIIAQSSTGEAAAEVFDDVSAIPALVNLLWRTNHERCVVACLNAFSALSQSAQSVSQCLAHVHDLIPVTMPLTRSLNHKLRLAACRLLTIFHSSHLLATGLECAICVALVHLLVTPDRTIQSSTALTLSELVTGSVRLQKAAHEAGAVVKLATIIFSVSGLDSSDSFPDDFKDQSDVHSWHEGQRSRNLLLASAFAALASVSSDFDSARDDIITNDLLPHVFAALSQTDVDILLAALKCIRSLGRSVKIVRRDLSNESLGHLLLSLLSSENQEVRRCASATICNLVLEFSPIRTAVLSGGGADTLVGMLRSEDGEIRTNALWSLKNLVYKADLETKRDVMSRLSYAQLQVLCRDMRPRVRELAMTIVRNLACPDPADSKNSEVDALFAETGDGFVSILAEALRIDSSDLSIAVQALYAVCNIASGSEYHKERLMNSEIPQLILQWTSHRDERARIAAVWCTINLSWKEAPSVSQGTTRTPQLLGQNGRLSVGRIQTLRRQGTAEASAERNILDDATIYESNSTESAFHSVGTSSGVHGESIDTHKDGDFDISDRRNHDSNNFRNATQDSSVKNYGYEWRMGRLRELGFEGRLRMLVNDPHIEVQGRARAALELFECEDVYPLDSDPGALLDYNPRQLRVSQSPQSPPLLLRGPGSDSSFAGSSA